jgi:hypothetical protein
MKQKNTHDFEPLKEKRVMLTKTSGALYSGILSGFNHKKNKVCLTHLRIMKGVNPEIMSISPKHENVRWFSLDNVRSIEVDP